MNVTSRKNGFSLVELLTVIAIIAILAAIIFPVMSTVKERARQGQCMTNLQQIATAVQLFKQDNRKYPDILGSRVNIGTWNGTYPPEMFENCKDEYLFAEYVKTINAFHCPSSKVTKSTDVIIHYKASGGKPEDKMFVYAYDSYDAAVISGGGPTYDEAGGAAATAAPHYRICWATNNDAGVATVDGQSLKPYPPPPPGGPDTDSTTVRQQDYERQLRWRNPPGDTLVTWCSYHEGVNFGGRCPVVFLDGHADAMPANEVEVCKWRIRPKKS